MRRILLTGATGALGGHVLRDLAGAAVTAWSAHGGDLLGVRVQAVDLADPDAVARAFHVARPQVVLHAGALATVAECHREPERARQVNVQASALLADLSAAAGARIVLVSTDLVFDGAKGNYDELDAPAPLSVYGRSKCEAEQAVLARPRSAAMRLSLLFGPTLTGRGSFFDRLVESLQTGQSVTCFADEWRTPLSLAEAARALVAVGASDFEGLLHMGGPERLSRLEMGLRLAAHLGADPRLVVATGRAQVAAAEPRPRDTSLNSAKWRRLFPELPRRSWQESLAEML
jgi:dTDP-4-dehydrorhamnose reductase